MRNLIKPNEVVENFYGTQLENSSPYHIPVEVVELTAKLRQMLVDYDLKVKITINNEC